MFTCICSWIFGCMYFFIWKNTRIVTCAKINKIIASNVAFYTTGFSFHFAQDQNIWHIFVESYRKIEGKDIYVVKQFSFYFKYISTILLFIRELMPLGDKMSAPCKRCLFPNAIALFIDRGRSCNTIVIKSIFWIAICLSTS